MAIYLVFSVSLYDRRDIRLRPHLCGMLVSIHRRSHGCVIEAYPLERQTQLAVRLGSTHMHQDESGRVIFIAILVVLLITSAVCYATYALSYQSRIIERINDESLVVVYESSVFGASLSLKKSDGKTCAKERLSLSVDPDFIHVIGDSVSVIVLTGEGELIWPSSVWKE